MPHSLIFLSDNIVELKNLINGVDGSYINNATVDLTLLLDNVAVAGQAWPTTMAYVAGSSGLYRGTISPSVAVIEGDIYIAQINVNAGVGLVKRYKCKVVFETADCGESECQ